MLKLNTWLLVVDPSTAPFLVTVTVPAPADTATLTVAFVVVALARLASTTTPLLLVTHMPAPGSAPSPKQLLDLLIPGGSPGSMQPPVVLLSVQPLMLSVPLLTEKCVCE